MKQKYFYLFLLLTGLKVFSQTDTFISSTCIGTTTGAQARFYSPLAEDFDGDTDKDIIVRDESGVFHLFTNDGSNNFSQSTILTGNWGGLISKDLDNDGDIDIVGSSGKIFINNGSAVFTELVGTFFTASGSIARPRIADFNGDGKQDILWLNGSMNSIDNNQLWINNGTTGNANFVLSSEFNNQNIYANDGTVVGDIDNDNDVDIVICGQGGWTGKVFTNDGSGVFTNTQNLSTYTGKGFLADWDKDGDIDFLAYDYYNNWGLRLWENDGTGTFGSPSSTSLIPVISIDYRVSNLVDLNGDTWLDVVYSSGLGARYYINSGCQLTLSSQVLSNSYNGIVVTDFTNDNKPDIFCAARDAQSCLLINDLNVQSYVAITTPVATTEVNYFLGDTAVQLSATGSNLLWYTSATGGTGNTTAPTPDTSTLGTTSYWVSSTNANGCESERVEMVVNVVAPATHLNFDGINDHVNLGTSLATALNGTTALTLEAWINPSVLNGWNNIITDYNGSYHKLLLRVRNNNNIQFWLNGTVLNSSFTVPLDTWTHVAAVYDGSNMYVYANGGLVASQSATVSLPTTTDQFNIGSRVGGSELFTGNIDEVRVWNTARTVEQISGAMNCELQGSESGLVAYYQFNQGVDQADNTSITTLTDATSNGNDGTLTNFTLTGTTSNWLAGSPVETGSVVPTTPIVTTPVTYNQNDTASALTATTGGSGLLWYTTETGGTGSTSAPTPDTSTAGSTSYWVSSTNANGCESERVEIVVNVNAEATHLNFDGASDRITGTNPNLPQGNSPRTIEAWVRNSTGNDMTIFNYGNINVATNQIYTLHLYNGVYIIGYFNDINTGYNINDGNWHHVAVSHDGTNSRIYVDGVLINTTSITYNTNGYDFQIGASNRNGSYLYNLSGSLDEVRVWNIALTEADILATMNCEAQSQPELVAYYKFNQGFDAADNSSITTLTDSSGNGIDGTLTNFALTGTTSNWQSGSAVTTGDTCATLSNSSFEAISTLKIYPNPSTGIFTIASEEELTITVYDIVGKVIKTQTINNGNNTLNISNYNAGVYFLNAINTQGETKTIKLIKN